MLWKPFFKFFLFKQGSADNTPNIQIDLPNTLSNLDKCAHRVFGIRLSS